MSDYTINGQRWIWDLYPLDRKAWVSRLDDGVDKVGTVLKHMYLESGPRPPASVTHQFYMPTDGDLDLLKQLYPDDEPVKPNWHRIAADLVAAGNDAATVNQSSATILLALLRKPQQMIPAPPIQESHGQGEDDYKTSKWFVENTSITAESLRKAVSDGRFLRSVGTKKKKRYSLTDAKAILGADIVRGPQA